ncbi:glycosyltransferase [Rhodococcus opacus]|nr:glycosyltransferase [Rhodococcus opacus]
MRRTLAWGHLYPRAGAESRSAPVRVLLRRLTAGTILYGYDSVVPARQDLPRKPLWVAPNSLYPKGTLRAQDGKRKRILYVGRLESMKNVQILVQAFIQSKLWSDGMSLDIVGFGSLEGNIRKDVESSGIRDHINVHGRIDDVESLADLYSESLFSVSPGYVGLSLTQSLGFGVPMLYAKNEPHAPEIELVRFAGTRDFSPSTVDALSEAMVSFAEDLRRSPTNRDSLAQQIQQHYSAESMADGLLRALRGEPMDLGLDGWPSSRWSGK